MPQTNLTISIDEDIRHDAENLFDNLGLTLSSAINMFFRQAVREQAIPFPIKAKTAEEKYSEYFTPQTVESIKKSIAQAERGDLITFSMTELEAMEDGEIPQRAIEFIKARKEAGSSKHD
jgi:DNA-damage-inducible protein J